MNSELRFSIITVSYNAANQIQRTLQSVQNQSYLNYEHIVIDGGSTDGTQAIIGAQESGPDIFISEPDEGIYDAMNKGLKLASGDVICFLNADDYYADSSVLADVERCFRSNNCELVLGDVAFFNPLNPERIVRRYRSNRFSPGKLAWGWMPAHPALFMRQSIVKKTGLFKTDYAIAGDYEFIVRAFRQQSITYHHLPKVLVRMGTGGVSTKGFASTILLNKEVIRACRENGLHTNWLKILSKYPFKLLEFLQK